MNELLLLEKLFGSRLRVAILSLLFSRQGEEFYPGEVARLIDEDRGNTSRELVNLEQVGITSSRRDTKQPNRMYYSLNQKFILFPEIKSIFLKTIGIVGVLREALTYVDGIYCAFIYGSIAAGTEGPSSDIDVMIIGDIGFEELSKILVKPEKALGREINPSLYSMKEFKARLKKADPFVSRLMEEPRILIIGEPDELQTISR